MDIREFRLAATDYAHHQEDTAINLRKIFHSIDVVKKPALHIINPQMIADIPELSANNRGNQWT